MTRINWDKIDPTGRHRDAVLETMQPLLEAISEDMNIDIDRLSWTITKERGPEDEEGKT
jgi:hypothetical protein